MLASHGNVYAPGGQSVFTDSKSGKDIFVYHYVPVNSPTPYSDTYASLGLNAIDWSSVSVFDTTPSIHVRRSGEVVEVA